MRWSRASLLLLIASFGAAGTGCHEADRALGPVAQSAYVWHRDWNSAVQKAISDHGAEFARLIVLNAEVSWKGKQPNVVRVPLDYQVLRNSGGAIGLALRIGPYSGPFKKEGEPLESICRLAAALVEEAKSHDLSVAELQVDFDCAERNLAGYEVWVREIRQRIAPTPLRITALPSWLRKRGFKPLVEAAGSYVLQVHSLERPESLSTPFTLCDPEAALRSVELAGRFGVPFRVALPTYGYTIAFDGTGRYLGLSAEGPPKSWPTDAIIREVRADPLDMARLVRTWVAGRPASLQGIIWYRMPVDGDVLNWRWPTLAAAMNGRRAMPGVRVISRSSKPGLVEIELLNEGEMEATKLPAVLVTLSSDQLVAADALGGFELVEPGRRLVRFQPNATLPAPPQLAPGQSRAVGWLRLHSNQGVQIETTE